MSQSDGRLDQPDQSDPPFDKAPWHNHPDMLNLCGLFLRSRCEQITQGLLWNFPGADHTHWHRDGRLKAVTVFVAAADYLPSAGWPLFQPCTHGEYKDHGAPREGDPPAVQVWLRKGESVLFSYQTKHAATPNGERISRLLLYGAYSARGMRDTENHGTAGGVPVVSIHDA